MISATLEKDMATTDGYIYHQVTVEKILSHSVRLVVSHCKAEDEEPRNEQGIDLNAKELRALAQILLSAAEILGVSDEHC